MNKPTVNQHPTLIQVLAAIDRGGMDISTCIDCDELVVCIPDGLPMCEDCAKKQMDRQ